MVTLERFWQHYETADAFYYLEPMPLTHDLLLKIGFEYNGCDSSNAHRYELNGFEIWRRKHTRTFYNYNVTINSVMGGLEIKYVHQLQNLYYAICQSELLINLS